MHASGILQDVRHIASPPNAGSSTATGYRRHNDSDSSIAAEVSVPDVPTEITISLSQEQLTSRPSSSTATKPSSIPKRAHHTRPSLQQTAAQSSFSATFDVYNEVFEDKPIATVEPSILPAAIVPNTIEKQSLLRKYSVPTIRTTAVTTTTSNSSKPIVAVSPPLMLGSAILGARLAGHRTRTTIPPTRASNTVTANRFNSATAAAANKYLDDRYKCTICCNPFNDPRVLDCLHTFCYVCLCNVETAAAAAAAAHSAAALTSSTSTTAVVAATATAVTTAAGDDISDELDYSVSGTVKSSELFPKSYSNTSSLGDAGERAATALSRLPQASSSSAKPAALARKSNLPHKHQHHHHLPRRSVIASSASITTAVVNDSTDGTTEIKCQQCGSITVVPMGGLNRLPRNYVAKRRVKDALMELGRDLHSTVWCGLCFTETAAIACCLICNLNLCTFCKEAHGRQRSTSKHDVRYLNDLRTNYLLQSEVNGPATSAVALVPGSDVGSRSSRLLSASSRTLLKCTIHPTHDLKLFCVTCYQVACNNCTILLHRNHKCEPIGKAAKVYVKMMQTSLDRTRPLIDYAAEAIAKLNSHAKRVNQRADTVQADVDRFLGEYLAALEVHQRTLHTQIGRAREAKLQTIREQQAELQQRCTDARQTIQFCDDLMEPGSSATEILTFVGVLLRRFEQCQRSRGTAARNVDPQLNSSSEHSLAFRAEICAPTTQEQHNIPLYGIITTQTAEPKLCTVAADGLMQLRIHRKAEVVMTARDAEDKPLCHGGLQVDVLVRYRDASQRSIPVKVADRRDGTYVISFVPDAAGAMLMSVQVHGKHVKASSFAMCARTLRPHSGCFHCCAFCSSRGSKTATCACGSLMPGGYRGCGHGHDGHPGRRHWSCCASDVETSECSATNAFR